MLLCGEDVHFCLVYAFTVLVFLACVVNVMIWLVKKWTAPWACHFLWGIIYCVHYIRIVIAVTTLPYDCR